MRLSLNFGPFSIRLSSHLRLSLSRHRLCQNIVNSELSYVLSHFQRDIPTVPLWCTSDGLSENLQNGPAELRLIFSTFYWIILLPWQNRCDWSVRLYRPALTFLYESLILLARRNPRSRFRIMNFDNQPTNELLFQNWQTSQGVGGDFKFYYPMMVLQIRLDSIPHVSVSNNGQQRTTKRRG